MIVDAHAHAFAAASPHWPREVSEQAPADREATGDALLAVLDAAGVDHAVLVPLDHHDDYVATCVVTHPARFSMVGVGDPAVPDPVADWARRRERSPLRGLRLFALGDPPRVELLRRLRDDDATLWFYGALLELEALERCLEHEDLGRLRVVLNHLGFPWPERLEVDALGRPRTRTSLPPPTLPVVRRLARFARVHVMVSGEYAFSREPFPFGDIAPVVQSVLEAYGAQRLLWASDWPWIAEEPGYAPQLELVDRYLPGLSSAERVAILGGTAARLFDLTDDGKVTK